MKNLLYLFLIGAAVVTACKGPQGDIGPQGPIGSQGSAGPQGVAGPNHRGDLMGFAQLLNEDGLIPTGVTDFSSVSVTAESNGIRTTAVSDRAGKFALPNLVMGTYTLTYERNGYGTKKVFEIHHIGGTLAPNPVPPEFIRAISTTQVNNLKVLKATKYSTSSGLVFAATRIDDKGSACNCRMAHIFFSQDPNPSSVKHTADLVIPVGNETGKEFTNSERFLDSADYVKGATPFKTGETVYAVIYGSSSTSYGYFDPATEQFYYTALNPNPGNIVKITWP